MTGLPDTVRWLFWDVDPADVDLEAHADFVLPRVLEKGRLVDVRWAIATYGLERIHAFFRDVGHPELSERTIHFWRAYFEDDEPWATPPAWRKSSSAPWID